MEYYLPQSLQILLFGQHLLPKGNYYPDFYPIDFFWPVFELHINGLKLYVLSWVWLLLLNVMFTKITLLHVVIILSFSLLINIPLCEYTTIFILSNADGRLNCLLFVVLQLMPL